MRIAKMSYKSGKRFDSPNTRSCSFGRGQKSRHEICQFFYTTGFLGQQILHTRIAHIATIFTYIYKATKGQCACQSINIFTVVTWNCQKFYMDLSKLQHGFVKNVIFVTYVC